MEKAGLMKILFVGDSPTVNTGFGIVAKNIVGRLHARGHTMVALGINFFGDPYDTKEYPYPIYPCDKGPSPDAIFGIFKLWAIVKEFQPDILFFLNDPWIIDKYMQAKNLETPYMKTIAYYPIDGGPLKKQWAKTLSEQIDVQVCYSKFAEDIITKANDGKRPKNLRQIYHGVDRKTFRPINQQAARQQLGIPLDSFVVGMVARNQYRKRFDLVVSAFSKFAKDKPEAKLYLHTVLKDIGYDIHDLVNQFDMEERLILTEDIQNPAVGVPEHFLNLIYNSFDINVLISMGDGFGLPVAESMATGCPQIVSNHSCLKELAEGHGGITVKTAAWLMNTAGLNTWGGLSDEQDLVDKLNLLYSSRDLRIKLSEEGYAYISQPQFDWDYIVDKFEELIKQIMHILVRKNVQDNIQAIA